MTTSSPDAVTVRLENGVAEIDAASWNRCAGASNPFVGHAFLSALETSGSATAKTGWQPIPIIVEDAGGSLTGALPA
jgi:uncharacterized protein